jgi:hypothetical protein
MSALRPIADIRRRNCHVRFVPKADIELAGINSETSAGILFSRHLGHTARAKSWCRIAARAAVARAAGGTKGSDQTYR